MHKSKTKTIGGSLISLIIGVVILFVSVPFTLRLFNSNVLDLFGWTSGIIYFLFNIAGVGMVVTGIIGFNVVFRQRKKSDRGS